MTTRNSGRVIDQAGNMSRANSRTWNRNPGGPTRTATTISFSGNTISDSGNGLGLFRAGCAIEVRGSVRNNRVYRVTTSAAGALNVVPALTTETAGATVTILGV